MPRERLRHADAAMCRYFDYAADATPLLMPYFMIRY